MSEIKRRSATPEPRFPCLPSLGEHCGECHRCTPVDEGRSPSCGCMTCDAQRRDLLPMPERLMRPFIVCPTCGNKRCPKATHHDLACTGSNEPGQSGSAYETAPARTASPTETPGGAP